MLAGKRGSRRHSTTSFSENVVVAGKGYQRTRFGSGEGLTSFTPLSPKSDQYQIPPCSITAL